MQELTDKIPPQFMCLSEHDLLSHSRALVLGVNIPQMYVKVRGVWTGGH